MLGNMKYTGYDLKILLNEKLLQETKTEVFSNKSTFLPIYSV